MNITGKKILVTGANGYIGSNVVKYLLDNGAEVTALDINANNIDPRATVVSDNLFKEGINWYELLGKPDICLHMAWRDGFVHNSEKHISDLPFHYRFLSNLIDGGLKQLAVMGTMHEIGFYEGEVDENTPCNPQSLYGIAKNSLRQMMINKTNNTDCVLQWLRCFYIYGNDKNNHSIFTKLLQAEEEGKEAFPFTSGKNKYDFIHIDELIKKICSAISQTDINGVINCCTGIPVSLGEKVEDFIKQNGMKIKLEYGKFPDRPYDSKIIFGDATKINAIIDNENCKKYKKIK